MTKSKDIGPLTWNVPIVNKSGLPSSEFQRRWNTQRQNNAGIISVTLGAGPPPATPTPTDASEYLDTSTNPFTFYVASGGTWHVAGGAVSSVFGRTGAVVAQTGDYTAAQVTNAADVTASNTFQQAQIIAVPGGAGAMTIDGETGSLIVAARFSNDANSPVWRSIKARGTIASPIVVNQNDVLGQFDFRAQVTPTGQGNAARIQATVIEPTPGSTALGSRLSMFCCALGAATLTEMVRVEVGTGLAVHGVVIADGSGVLKVPNSGVTAGSYTNSNITVGADGRVTAASNGSSGSGGRNTEATWTKPLVADFGTTVNIVRSSASNGTNALLIDFPGVNANNELYLKSAPATPYDINARFKHHIDSSGGQSQAGIVLRNSTSGKIIIFGMTSQSNSNVLAQNWNSATSFNTTIGNVAMWPSGPTPWFNIHNDGTNLLFQLSEDGWNWHNVFTSTLAAFISSVNQVGLYVFAGAGVAYSRMVVHSFGTALPAP